MICDGVAQGAGVAERLLPHDDQVGVTVLVEIRPCVVLLLGVVLAEVGRHTEAQQFIDSLSAQIVNLRGFL